MASVLLHYFGGSSVSWRHVYPLLQERCPDCLIVALDLPGHGNSPDAESYTVTQMAQDVRETLDSLDALRGLPYLLVGHSMGGKVALRLAAMQPPGLTGLVLVAPSPPTPEPMTEDERQSNLAAWGSEAASRETLKTITGLPLAAEDAEQWVRDRARTTRGAWQAWFEKGSRENIGGLMDQVDVTTVILAGENDPVITPDVQRHDTLGYLRNAFLSVVPGAGHLLPYEAPELTVEVIVSSLPLFT